MITQACTCSLKQHNAPIDKFIIENKATEKIPEILFAYKKILIVCDTNTYNALGKRVEQLIAQSGKLFNIIILQGKVLPNEHFIGEVLINIANPYAQSDIYSYSPLPDFILAVGSGVINDICRLVAYRLNLPYGIAASAVSMDGFASSGSAILFNNTKSTIRCTTPKFIIADTEVLSKAPYEMMLAGIGDMIGKFTGLLDWELARDFDNEFFCEQIAENVLAAAKSCLQHGYSLKQGSIAAIEEIMKGFMVSGLGMAYLGNSRPASGSEHIIAHAWELEGIKNNAAPNLHGLEVCKASLLVAFMYERLYLSTDDERLKCLIGKYLIYFKDIKRYVKEIKMPLPKKDKSELVASVRRALLLRDRYTILYYLNDRNLLEDYADYAADSLLNFEK